MDPYEELLRYIFGENVPGEGVRPYEGKVQSLILKDGSILSLRSVLEEVLGTLPWKKGIGKTELRQLHRMVLVLRFGLEDLEKHSLKEAGCELGISEAWTRELQYRARALLRHPTRSQHLVAFVPGLAPS